MQKTYIYFIKPARETGGNYKIGCSADPAKRLKAITSKATVPLELVGYVPGSHGDEKRIHRAFQRLRLHGEWFRTTNDLAAFVDRCIELGRVAPIPSEPEYTTPKAPSNEAMILRAADLYDVGMTHDEIAGHLGINAAEVRQLLKTGNVTPRRNLSATTLKKRQDNANYIKENLIIKRLKLAIDVLADGNVALFSRLSGMPRTAIYTYKEIPPAYCRKIAKASKGRLKLSDLRPDLWGR